VKYWLGFMGLFWGAFIIRRRAPALPAAARSPAPDRRVLVPWLVAAVAAALVAGLILLPYVPR